MKPNNDIRKLHIPKHVAQLTLRFVREMRFYTGDSSISMLQSSQATNEPVFGSLASESSSMDPSSPPLYPMSVNIY